jgi:hypothetical protein
MNAMISITRTHSILKHYEKHVSAANCTYWITLDFEDSETYVMSFYKKNCFKM